MVDDVINSAFIGMFLSGLAQLLILIGCIIIVIKQRSLNSYILLMGIISMILVSVGGIIWPLLASKEGPEKLIEVQGTLSILSGLAYLIFSFGVLLLATNLIGKDSKDLLQH